MIQFRTYTVKGCRYFFSFSILNVWISPWSSKPRFDNCGFYFRSLSSLGETGMAQWLNGLPPTNVAWVRIPVPASYVG